MNRTAESTSALRPSARNWAVNLVMEVMNPREMTTETVPANHCTWWKIPRSLGPRLRAMTTEAAMPSTKETALEHRKWTMFRATLRSVFDIGSYGRDAEFRTSESRFSL